MLVDADGTPHDAAQRPDERTSAASRGLSRAPGYRLRRAYPSDDVRRLVENRRIFARDTVGASETLRDCAWTPYRKNGTAELAELCAASFAAGVDVVMMERHGLSVIAATLEDAFMQTDLAEEAARIAYYGAVVGAMRA